MNPDKFQDKFIKHEEKSQGEYHAEFVKDVLDIVIDQLVTDYVSSNNIRKEIIRYLDAEYGEVAE